MIVIGCHYPATDPIFGTVRPWNWGTRVSIAKQDLDRQVDALLAVGIDPKYIYRDKKSGATVQRPGLKAVLKYARSGDVIVVHTLDRLGRAVRDNLNVIHELAERGIGVRNLADPSKSTRRTPMTRWRSSR